MRTRDSSAKLSEREQRDGVGLAGRGLREGKGRSLREGKGGAGRGGGGAGRADHPRPLSPRLMTAISPEEELWGPRNTPDASSSESSWLNWENWV